MLARILAYSQAYNFYNWVFKRRSPEPGVVFLGQRRVYILPTRQGLAFGVALILMLIGSINYNLSLGYVLTFLLAGLGVVSILHTFRNLAHLYVAPGRIDPVFAGDMARFGLLLESRSRLDRHGIDLFSRGGERVSCDVPAASIASVQLPVKTQTRGWLPLDRVTIETRFPLGLMRAWAYVQPDMRVLVYPTPDHAPLPPDVPVPDSGDAMAVGTGADDFTGLRTYDPSDSPRHIAWKAAARGGPLLTKTFSGRASAELWFDWAELPSHMGVEARLSRLTRWVLLAQADGVRFGLRLPGATLPQAHGAAHLERCLQALALYEA